MIFEDNHVFVFVCIIAYLFVFVCIIVYCVFVFVIDDILAVLVLHGVVDVPPTLKSKLVSQLRPPVSPLHHRLHLHRQINHLKDGA